LKVGSEGVTALWHPTEEKLAVLRGGATTIQILDAESGKVLKELPHPTIHGLFFAWHPAGKLLASGCQEKVYLWKSPTVRLYKILEGHQNQVRGCAFNHGGDLLASHAWDDTTRLWDPTSGKELVSLRGIFSRFRRDDRQMAFAYSLSPEVGIWEVATGRECRT